MLWQTVGIEELIFRDNGIEIIHRRKLFRNTVFLGYEDVESITEDGDPNTPLIIQQLGLGGGRIVIATFYGNRRFGQDLRLIPALKMLDQMNIELAKRKAAKASSN